MSDSIFVGGVGEGHATPQALLLKYGNRHGLVAGATGTGKTVTLQILAEGFSAAGVPVFLSDIKGDVSGLAAAGSETHKLHQAFQERAARIGYADYRYRPSPSPSGTSSASRATRSAPPWPRWGRSCCRG
jgi:DNA helicase HerA-like ATPase